MQRLLPRALTRDQAEALKEVVLQEVFLDEMLDWIESGRIGWKDYRDSLQPAEAKRFRSLQHLWIGNCAIYREPPIICPTRIDRIVIRNQGVTVYHTLHDEPGFMFYAVKTNFVSAPWDVLRFNERFWHAVYANFSFLFRRGHSFADARTGDILIGWPFPCGEDKIAPERPLRTRFRRIRQRDRPSSSPL